MKLSRPEPRREVAHRLGADLQPEVDDVCISRDGKIGVVVPLKPGDNEDGIRFDDGTSIFCPWDTLLSLGWRFLEANRGRYRRHVTGWARRCEPFEVSITGFGCCLGTLGDTELEMAAACVVSYHRERGLTSWSPMKLSDFKAWLIESERVRRWSANPLWRPDFPTLMTGRWVDGWLSNEDEKDPDAVGHVSSKMIECLATPRVGGFPKIQRVLSK